MNLLLYVCFPRVLFVFALWFFVYMYKYVQGLGFRVVGELGRGVGAPMCLLCFRSIILLIYRYNYGFDLSPIYVYILYTAKISFNTLSSSTFVRICLPHIKIMCYFITYVSVSRISQPYFIEKKYPYKSHHIILSYTNLWR